jgi:hypothetical protein
MERCRTTPEVYGFEVVLKQSIIGFPVAAERDPELGITFRCYCASNFIKSKKASIGRIGELYLHLPILDVKLGHDAKWIDLEHTNVAGSKFIVDPRVQAEVDRYPSSSFAVCRLQSGWPERPVAR